MGVPYAEVIGDPIAHSKSPVIHKFWLKKLDLAGDYRRTRISAEDLPSYLAGRRGDPDWRGCNVAMPHKAQIWELLGYAKRFDREGAVNCVAYGPFGLQGLNFDVDALLESLPVSDGPLAIVGSGGAAGAAVEASLQGAVRIVARDEQRGLALAGQALERGRWFPLEKAATALTGAGGLINATPLGMAGYPSMPSEVLDGLSNMRRGAFVCDMVYHPVQTELLARAHALDMAMIDGLTLLIAQAAHSFERFFRVPAPREHDADLRELLTS